MSDGLRYEFNYTWSHSIDNTSVTANNNALFTNSNLICDILYPRACRGSSDFDVRQEINSNFHISCLSVVARMYLAQRAALGWMRRWVGGASPACPPTALACHYCHLGRLPGFIRQPRSPAIFTGSPADLKTAVNVNHTSKTVYMFPGGSAGATKVLSEFRGPIGIEYGQRNIIRGPGAFFFDAGLGKEVPDLRGQAESELPRRRFQRLQSPCIQLHERNLDIVNNASQFGQIDRTVTALNGNSARVAQFSLRLDF